MSHSQLYGQLVYSCCRLLRVLMFAGIADVVTLGDSWLAPAIRRRLVQPITSAETYRWWQRLPRRWLFGAPDKCMVNLSSPAAACCV
jgi:hypothetical protein